MTVDPTRRRMLAASAAGAVGSLLPASRAHASGGAWGELPSGVWPGASPAYKILEIHLYGGLSPWESFYFRPGPGPQFRGFGPGSGAAGDVFSSLQFNGGCAGAPGSATASQPFDSTDATHPIHFGPITSPLWAPSIFDRTRVVVLQHDLLPHEAAIPYAASGFRLGNPKLAGLGAAIQHRALAIEETKPEAMRRRIPFSFVLRPLAGGFPGDNVQVFSATGQHPGAARPVVIDSDQSRNLLSLLDRSAGPTPRITPEAEQVFNYYRAQYRDLLRFSGSGNPIRSRGFADYEAAAGNLIAASLLRTLFTGSPSVSLSPTSEPHCASLTGGPFTSQENITSHAIRLAAHLLGHPTAPAHYACVVDDGLVTTSGGGYDTHTSGHVLATSVNLLNVLSTLRALVDAGQLDLNSTMVVLTTEFGRTPYRSSMGSPSPSSGGRDHFPQGFVNVLIGGPIATRAVVGRLRDSDGVAVSGQVFNCSDVRAAVLLAAGIFPFADALFGTTDITTSLIDAGSHDVTAANVRRQLLGVPG